MLKLLSVLLFVGWHAHAAAVHIVVNYTEKVVMNLGNVCANLTILVSPSNTTKQFIMAFMQEMYGSI